MVLKYCTNINILNITDIVFIWCAKNSIFNTVGQYAAEGNKMIVPGCYHGRRKRGAAQNPDILSVNDFE